MLERRCVAVVTVSLCASCASITSVPYAERGSVDGILYKLPMAEITAATTWRLTQCTPSPILTLESFEVSQRLVPDRDPSAWFVIDPSQMQDLTTSVDPARIELKDEMLAKVTFKAKSELREVVKTGVGLAARLATGGFAALGRDKPLACHPDVAAELAAADSSEHARLKHALEATQKQLSDVEKRFLVEPSENLKLVLDRLDARVIGLAARLKGFSDERFTISVQTIGAPQVLNGSNRRVFLDSDLASFTAWFNLTSQQAQNDLKKLIEIVADIEGQGPSTPPPQTLTPTPYPGIFYRQPVSALVTVQHTPSRRVRQFEASLPQLGSLARLELQNIAFGARGFTVEWDEKGRLKLYEATSTAAAMQAIGAAEDARAVIEGVELERLERELKEIEMRKKLIDAQEALDAAQMK